MRTKDFLGLTAEKKGLVMQSMWFWNVREECMHIIILPGYKRLFQIETLKRNQRKKYGWSTGQKKRTMNKEKRNWGHLYNQEKDQQVPWHCLPLELFTSADYFSSTFDFLRLTQCLWHSGHFVNLSWMNVFRYAGGICKENNDHVWPVYKCGIFFNIHTQAWTSRSSNSYRETLHLFPLCVLSA